MHERGTYFKISLGKGPEESHNLEFHIRAPRGKTTQSKPLHSRPQQETTVRCTVYSCQNELELHAPKPHNQNLCLHARSRRQQSGCTVSSCQNEVEFYIRAPFPRGPFPGTPPQGPLPRDPSCRLTMWFVTPSERTRSEGGQQT